MSSYPAAGCLPCVSADEWDLSAGMTVAVRLAAGLAAEERRHLGDGDRSALVIGGHGEDPHGRAGGVLKVVAVTAAVVTRDGQVRAEGRPYEHATLGPLEDWLDAQAGPGVIDGIAERAVLDKRFVKGKYRRLLTAAFMIRVLVLWTLMPGAQLSDVIIALAGDLALVPWSRRWQPASERACLDWRKALGPAPLEELQAAVLAAAGREHRERDGESLTAGRGSRWRCTRSTGRCCGCRTRRRTGPRSGPSAPPTTRRPGRACGCSR